MTNKCTKNKSHATHLGISARLTAVVLTKLGDVSTVAKTLVSNQTQNKVQCAKLSSLHPRSRPTHAHSTHAQSAHSHILSSCMSASLGAEFARRQRVKNTYAETLIPCLDGPGAPHASLPNSCALGRQRFQRRRLLWHCFQYRSRKQRLHHHQRLPAAHAEQPREPDAQQTARLHLQASTQLLPIHGVA